MVGIDHRFPPAVAHRPKALDKKSRSITSSPTFARNSLISTAQEASWYSCVPAKLASTCSRAFFFKFAIRFG